MFRLLESGLPKDKDFPPDFESLGYFINEDDEIRKINNPRAYFNYFLTKSDRCNNLQREAMNSAIRREVHSRLIGLGLNILRLPLGAKKTEPHIPIYVSKNIHEKKRVIILFYEHSEDLGIFAYRIVCGKGGINEGSAVNFVKYIQSLSSGPNQDACPGIILANMGQLLWYRKGKTAVTWRTWNSLPQMNAVSGPLVMDPAKNRIPGNASPAEHVKYIFNNVVKDLLDPMAVLDIIGVSDATNEVVQFLNDPQNWNFFHPRLNALALVAPYYLLTDLTNPGFAAWLRKRGRAYPFSRMSGYQAVGGPDGGSGCVGYGCNAYNLGDGYYIELMLPVHYKFIVDWLQELANDPNYENEELDFPNKEKEEGEEYKERYQNGEADTWETTKAAMAQKDEHAIIITENHLCGNAATIVDTDQSAAEQAELVADISEYGAENKETDQKQTAIDYFTDASRTDVDNGQPEYIE